MNLKIFHLGSNPLLSERIAQELGRSLGAVELSTFADGEKYVQFKENLRGQKVFLIQSTNQPDGNILNLLIGIDAVHRAGGRPIAVIPYFGYARQERKSAPREPITARLLANLLETAGVKNVLTMDLHANAIEGFFQQAKIDQIYARPVFLDLFKNIFSLQIASGSLVIGTPDASGAGPGRARAYAKHLGERCGGKEIPLVVVDKRRGEHNKSEVRHVLGDVAGKTVVLVDDIFDTCGTILKAADAILAKGAVEVYAAGTHGLFSGDAIQKIEQGSIRKVFVTDTVYNTRVKEESEKEAGRLQIVSVGKIFSNAIRSINGNESVSKYFL